MTNEPRAPEEKRPAGPDGEAKGPAVNAAADPAAPPVGEPLPPSMLTPEEQMDRFAQELKDKDWGHQPC